MVLDHFHTVIYILVLSELKNGVYYSTRFTTLQKKRMVAGVFTEYSQMMTDDIAMFNRKDALLVLVLPRVPNIIAWELTRDYTSNCGTYDLHASINIILEHLTDLTRLQLILEDDEVEAPLLQNFSKPIRLIGKLFLHMMTLNNLLFYKPIALII